MAVTGYELTYCICYLSILADLFCTFKEKTYVKLGIRSIEASRRRTSRARAELATTATNYFRRCIGRRSTRLVLGGRGQDGGETSRGQRLDKSPDILLSPTIIVRNDDIEGACKQRRGHEE